MSGWWSTGPAAVASTSGACRGCATSTPSPTPGSRRSTDENPTALTYSWNFGNGSGSGAVATRTYTAANTYTVTLTARDEWGLTATSTQTVTIAVPAGNRPPTAVFNPPACSGLSCNVSAVGSTDPVTGDALTYRWAWGDGTPDATTAGSSHTFPADGTYTVTLTVTDGWGAATVVTRDVTVSAPPPSPQAVGA